MDETLYFHALATSVHGGYHALRKIRAGHATWSESYDALAAYGADLPDPAEISGVLRRTGARVVLKESPEYPSALREIAQPPFGLYVRGPLPSNTGRTAVAVVGTRRASPEGKKIARGFARALAGQGFAIVSGLAFGIDAAAHEGCLDAGGRTIAVLAGGLDAIHPRSHAFLADRILDRGGAIVSEYPPSEAPLPYRFIKRNRIISGVARGTVVVEAPASSGALATARYALEQDRDLFIVPGSTLVSGFEGSHELIRQGAQLVTGPDQILAEYNVRKRHDAPPDDPRATPEEILILRALRTIGGPAEVDKLSAMTKLEPRIVNRALSFLIIRGTVRETNAGYTI